jgi:mono/diheme cytochrome c family protein
MQLTIGSAAPLLLLAVAGCQTVGEAPPSDPSMGLLIAQNNCSRCHLIGGAGSSPNANAPTFREIVNRPGMTPDALAGWLRDGHNYPVEMGFHLEPHQVDSLVAYMIRSRSDELPSGS